MPLHIEGLVMQNRTTSHQLSNSKHSEEYMRLRSEKLNCPIVETKNAIYLIVFERHSKNSSNLADLVGRCKCNAIVIETGMETYEDVGIYPSISFPELRETVLKNLSLRDPNPIFYVDMPYRMGHIKAFSAEIAQTVGPLLAGAFLANFNAIPQLCFIPFAIPLASLIIGALPSRHLAGALGDIELGHFYTSASLRSAVSAEKMDNFIAPALQRQDQKPIILVGYGSGHHDIITYLEHERLRKTMIKLHWLWGYYPSDKRYLDRISEVNYNGNPLDLGEVVYERTADDDRVQVISRIKRA
jgi:hypothetical protein